MKPTLYMAYNLEEELVLVQHIRRDVADSRELQVAEAALQRAITAENDQKRTFRAEQLLRQIAFYRQKPEWFAETLDMIVAYNKERWEADGDGFFTVMPHLKCDLDINPQEGKISGPG